MLRDFITDRSGATVIEYTLIAAGISLLISAAVFAFGGDLSGLFARFDTIFNPSE